ncbi:copper amine oxidase N-terminal domain-containing protein [Acetivibrio cellulolyticus]|uniref:copper amine oxidase N-terminal domain-containing protein n=1 Tax=Acetivibrio cellulolyticus TaxID=35830 RepID=UPI0001E2C78D|nr:copper amine oxidase N-terminal domain-containing protein [Acetivibrio cellulolyticus]
MRKLSFIMLISLILAMFSVNTWATSDNITVKVDGSQVAFPDAKPFIQPDTSRTMIPIRFVAESMGADVQWVANAKTVLIKKGNKTITLVIGYKKAVVNSAEVTFDAAAIIVQDRTFVPLRFVSEALGSSVNWIQATRTVDIKTEVYEKSGFIVPKDCSISVYIGDDTGDMVCFDLDVESEYALEKQYSDLKTVLSSKFSETLVNQVLEHVKKKTVRDYELKFKSFDTEDGKYMVGSSSGAGNPIISISALKK